MTSKSNPNSKPKDSNGEKTSPGQTSSAQTSGQKTGHTLKPNPESNVRPKVSNVGQTSSAHTSGQTSEQTSGQTSKSNSKSNTIPKDSSFGGQTSPALPTGQTPVPTTGQTSVPTTGQTSVPTSGQISKPKDELKSVKQKKIPKLPEYDIDLLKKKGITIGTELNSGSFSIVCKAFMKEMKVAVKIIDLDKTSDEVRKKFLPRELYTMTKLKHPNIIAVLQIYTLKDVRIYIFMEMAEGGDFLQLVKAGPICELKAKDLYKGVADALRYIHEQGFAHRDIKCENMLLLNKEKTISKISDFGFSRTCFESSTGERLLSTTYCGSAAYAAPEVLRVQPYNPIKSDVWSMGVVLYVLVNCRLPFIDKNLKEMYKIQMNRKLQFLPNLSDLCKDLIQRQLEPDLQKRYTMKQVLDHKWFHSSD